MENNNRTVSQHLEELARIYLGVMSFHSANSGETYTLTTQKIEEVLTKVYLFGEQNGYKSGFHDAKTACNCALDNLEHNVINKQDLDIEND